VVGFGGWRCRGVRGKLFLNLFRES